MSPLYHLDLLRAEPVISIVHSLSQRNTKRRKPSYPPRKRTLVDQPVAPGVVRADDEFSHCSLHSRTHEAQPRSSGFSQPFGLGPVRPRARAASTCHPPPHSRATSWPKPHSSPPPRRPSRRPSGILVCSWFFPPYCPNHSANNRSYMTYPSSRL